MIELSSETIAAIVGVMSGALVSGAAYFWRNRRDRLQALNQCLFSLMDIWHRLHTLGKSDSRLIINIVRQKALALGVDENELNVTMNQIESTLVEEFRIAMNNMARIGMDTLRQDYIAAVKLLSKEKPLLAYRLSGHQDFNERLAAVTDYFERLSVTEPFKGMDHSDIKSAAMFWSNNISSMMLDVLEEDLIDLAWATNIFAYREVRKNLSDRIAQVENEIKMKAEPEGSPQN